MISSEKTRNALLIITATIAILFICGYLVYIPITKHDYISISTIIVSISTTLIVIFCFYPSYYYKKSSLLIILIFVFISACACCIVGLIRWAPQYAKYIIDEPLNYYWGKIGVNVGEKGFSSCSLFTISSTDPLCTHKPECKYMLKAKYYVLQEISAIILLILGIFQLINFFVIIFTSKISPVGKRSLEKIHSQVVVLDSEGQQVGTSSTLLNSSSKTSKTSVPPKDPGNGSEKRYSDVIYPDVISEISGAESIAGSEKVADV